MDPLVNQLVRFLKVKVSVSTVLTARYNPNKNEVVLPVFWDEPLFMFIKNISGRRSFSRFDTLYHEIGHALDRCLCLRKTKEYKRLFGDASLPYRGLKDLRMFQEPDEGFVSAYAGSHPIEDFADTFVAYISGWEFDDPIIEKKLKFVEKSVKKALRLS